MTHRNVISRLAAFLAPITCILAPGQVRAEPAARQASDWLAHLGFTGWHDHGVIVLLVGLGLVVVFVVRYRGALRGARTAGEVRYRSLVEAAPFGIAVHRRDRVLFINDSGRRILGLAGDRSGIGATLEALAPITDAGPADHPFSILAPDPEESPDPVRLRRADGGIVETRLTTIESEFDGGPARLTFFRDVTAERAAQRELAANRERLGLALEAARDGVWDLDLDSGRVVANRAFGTVLAQTGAAPADHASWRALVHPVDRARLDEAIATHRRDASTGYEGEMRVRRPDGSEHWILEQGHVTEWDHAGLPVRMAGTIRDITERKRAEQRLDLRGRLAAAFLVSRGAELRGALGTILQEVMDAPCSWVGVLDANGGLRLTSTFQAAMGTGPEHLLLDPSDVPADLRQVMAATAPLILADAGENTSRTPLLGARLHGGDRVLGLVAVAGRSAGFRDEDASTLAGIAADLAPLVQAHLETEVKDAQLLQAQKMEALGVLAGGIAHDFNNILQAIMGFASLARQDVGDAAHLDADLDRVQRATVRGRDLVQRILQFSRPEAVESAPLDPLPLLQELAQHLRATLPGRIVVESRLATDCGRIHAEPQPLRQALINLTENARQAMDAGGGTLSLILRRLPIRPDDARFPADWCCREVIEIAVADTGPGIPERHRRRLFDPFFTTREVGQGSGLGLSVVHGLVTALGGRVGIECPAEGGTTASIYLPRQDAAGTATAETDVCAITAVTTGGPSGRILFVDDDAEIRDLAVALLGRAGHQVEVAADGLAAAQRLEAAPGAFDIVITDQFMPGMTGSELALRVHTLRPGLPVILVTGLEEPHETGGAGEALFREVVTKPFFGQALCLAACRALVAAAAHRQPGPSHPDGTH